MSYEDYGSSSFPEDDALLASSEWDKLDLEECFLLAKVNLVFGFFNDFSNHVPMCQVNKSTGDAVQDLVILLGPAGDTIE